MKLLRLFILLLCFSGYQIIANAKDTLSVHHFIHKTAEEVMSIASSNLSDETKHAELSSCFIKIMDIPWIAKFVLGRHWQSLSTKEQERYHAVYQKYLIHSYVPLFRKYNGQKIDIVRIDEGKDGEYIAVTKIKNPSNPRADIDVQYRLIHSNGTFKVRDILAEGVSLLQTQRSDFSALIANSGFEDFLNKLQAKANG